MENKIISVSFFFIEIRLWMVGFDLLTKSEETSRMKLENLLFKSNLI